MDVHAETIAAAMAEKEQAVRDLGIVPNREESVRKLVKNFNEGDAWAACYEAGPTGYTLCWQLTRLGVPCVVIAPTLVPSKAGDRVKTDRQDAQRLPSCFQAGELTPVWATGPNSFTKPHRIECHPVLTLFSDI